VLVVFWLCLICILWFNVIVCYFSVAVLGRVDEKCALSDSTDVKVDEPMSHDQAQRLKTADEPVQELQHMEVNPKLNGQSTEEKLQGYLSYC